MLRFVNFYNHFINFTLLYRKLPYLINLLFYEHSSIFKPLNFIQQTNNILKSKNFKFIYLMNFFSGPLITLYPFFFKFYKFIDLKFYFFIVSYFFSKFNNFTFRIFDLFQSKQLLWYGTINSVSFFNFNFLSLSFNFYIKKYVYIYYLLCFNIFYFFVLFFILYQFFYFFFFFIFLVIYYSIFNLIFNMLIK